MAAFGRPGGAGGVQPERRAVRERRLGGAGRGQVGGRGRGQEGIHGPHPARGPGAAGDQQRGQVRGLPADHHLAHGGQAGRVHRGGHELGADRQQPGPAVPGQRGQVGAGGHGADRDRHRAQVQPAEEQREQVGPVGQAQQQPFLGADPGRGQRRRGLPGPLLELAVADVGGGAVGRDGGHRDLARGGRGRAAEQPRGRVEQLTPGGQASCGRGSGDGAGRRGGARFAGAGGHGPRSLRARAGVDARSPGSVPGPTVHAGRPAAPGGGLNAFLLAAGAGLQCVSSQHT